ncbi:hypothetical protein CEUSTIGMA_g12199.t1, partial [Chlamydomonas eustigma]
RPPSTWMASERTESRLQRRRSSISGHSNGAVPQFCWRDEHGRLVDDDCVTPDVKEAKKSCSKGDASAKGNIAKGMKCTEGSNDSAKGKGAKKVVGELGAEDVAHKCNRVERGLDEGDEGEAGSSRRKTIRKAETVPNTALSALFPELPRCFTVSGDMYPKEKLPDHVPAWAGCVESINGAKVNICWYRNDRSSPPPARSSYNYKIVKAVLEKEITTLGQFRTEEDWLQFLESRNA